MSALTAYAIFHVACGVISFGLMYAYCQKQYPEVADLERGKDLLLSSMGSINGPLILLSFIIFLCTKVGFKHGLKYYRIELFSDGQWLKGMGGDS